MALIPHAEQAYIAREKLTEYLLNIEHPRGGGKAKFFLAFGYERSRPEVLEDDLLKLAREFHAVVTDVTDLWSKFVILGDIQTPSGRIVQVTSTWQIDDGDDRPRLITAYPLKRRRESA